MEDAMEASTSKNQEDSIKLDMPQSLLQFLNNSQTLFDIRNKYLSLKDNEVIEISFGKCNELELVQKLFSCDLSKAFRLKNLMQKSRHWVKWIINVDGGKLGLPILSMQFKHLQKLDIIVVESSVSMPKSDSSVSALSDILIRAENILHFVRKEDYGFECPSENSKNLMAKARVEFSELSASIGYPYNWVQDISNLVLETEKEDLTLETEQKNLQENIKAIVNIVRLIFARFTYLLEIWKETRDSEFRYLSAIYKSVRFTSWASVEANVLERLFRLEEDLYPADLRQVKSRFLMAIFHSKKFEVRIAAILLHKFPVQLPSFKIEVLEKKGSRLTFVDHQFLKTMEQSLNQESLINGIDEQSAFICQLLKIIFYVDELLQYKTFQIIRGSRKTSISRSQPKSPLFRISKKITSDSSTQIQSIKSSGILKRKLVTEGSPSSAKILKLEKCSTKPVSKPLVSPNNPLEEHFRSKVKSKVTSNYQLRERKSVVKVLNQSFIAAPDESANLDLEDAVRSITMQSEDGIGNEEI